MNQPPEVLCAGIVVADHVCTPISHVPAAGELVMADGMLLTIGGCAANAAVDLGKMGIRAAVVGRVGSDSFGRIVTDMLREHGVEISALQFTPHADTSQTLIVNVVGQDRRFIHTFGANAHFRAADIPMSQLDHCRVLYVGGYLVLPGIVQEELAAVFAAAQQKGVTTVLDVVVPAPGPHLKQLDRLLPHVDVFLPNNFEAELLCGKASPLEQAEFFYKRGVKTVVITMGAEGSILVQEGKRLRAGVFSVPYVDGSGGGDAFDAGFICGLLRGLDAAGCLRLASALGASCVRAIGTTPGVFTQAECDAFLANHSLEITDV